MIKKGVYLTLLGVIIFVILCLPVIKIPISSSSRGVVRAELENSVLKPIVGGKVVYNKIEKNNQYVNKGDTLVVVLSDQLKNQLDFLNEQIRDYSSQREDLENLTSGNFLNLKTGLYMKEYTTYKEKYSQIKMQLDLSKEDYKRANKLHQEGVYPKAEYDKYYFAYKGLENQLYALKESQIAQWFANKVTIERELRNFDKEVERLKKEENNYTIVAPISGRITNYSGIQLGTYLIQGESIASLSSNSDLIVENYVSPRDIGYIFKNQKVKIQVDTYNYNQWGLLEGKVIEIDKNITVNQQTGETYFRVLCSMDQSYLQLKNTYKGDIEKGMTLTTRFYLLDRTLWQLLFDRIDDWFNPNLK